MNPESTRSQRQCLFRTSWILYRAECNHVDKSRKIVRLLIIYEIFDDECFNGTIVFVLMKNNWENVIGSTNGILYCCRCFFVKTLIFNWVVFPVSLSRSISILKRNPLPNSIVSNFNHRLHSDRLILIRITLSLSLFYVESTSD